MPLIKIKVLKAINGYLFKIARPDSLQNFMVMAQTIDLTLLII